MNEVPQEIESGVWVHVIKKDDTGDVIVCHGPNTKFEDAIGLLHAAIIRYETIYKIEIEQKNMEHLQQMSESIAENVSKLAQSAKDIENIMIRAAAAAQNVMRTVKS